MLEKKIVLFLLFNSTPFNGTKYVFGKIVAVNQLDGEEVVAEGDELTVPVNSDLLCMDAASATEFEAVKPNNMVIVQW